jgi:hypothetical protein
MFQPAEAKVSRNNLPASVTYEHVSSTSPSTIYFASVPTVVHYRHDWPPASPHPEVR